MTDVAVDTGFGEAHSRAYYDISQLLESADDSDARVIQALQLLRALVPYDQCAVFEALPGRERRLVTAPGTPPEALAELTATTTALLGRLVEGHIPPADLPPSSGMHLAVPLVGLDEVLGVLFVRSAGSIYEERHVRALSVVAAKIAGYLSLLNAFVREAERAEALAEARRAAEAADRAKDEFLALVSHELRTPLNAILAWTDALRSESTSDADRARAIDAIERSVRTQAKLIGDLLDLSCVAAATLRLDLRAVEPVKVIKEAIRAVQPHAEKKAIRLEVSLDESVTPIIADPLRLNQIVLNLVTNAIKFTPAGGHVEVRLERAGAHARLRVTDSGAGITPDILPKLFEPFSPADATTTRPHGGLGVGLALVKDLVELHGGSVRAESPGDQKGTIFTVELPLAEETRGAQKKAVARSLAGIRVLIVDDDRDIGEVLQFVLEREGAVVTVATSAAEALTALERSMPDVLLSDVAMPGESGYDLMRKIVVRKGAKAPPAAALSSYSPGVDHDEARASGFRMLLQKPIDPETLVRAVATLALDRAPTSSPIHGREP
jgi:signal transduction histidine kinase/ActR/RegA family two-component response regulator